MRIFRRSPDLSHQVSDLKIQDDSSFVEPLVRKCMKRFMNINKLQTVIQDSLNKRELSHQTKILVKIIRYINQQPRGKEISSDMLVASIRAFLQKHDSTESIFLGEALIGEIESVAARRRLIGIYISLTN